MLAYNYKEFKGHLRPDFLVPATCLNQLTDELIKNLKTELDLVIVSEQ